MRRKRNAAQLACRAEHGARLMEGGEGQDTVASKLLELLDRCGWQLCSEPRGRAVSTRVSRRHLAASDTSRCFRQRATWCVRNNVAERCSVPMDDLGWHRFYEYMPLAGGPRGATISSRNNKAGFSAFVSTFDGREVGFGEKYKTVARALCWREIEIQLGLVRRVRRVGHVPPTRLQLAVADRPNTSARCRVCAWPSLASSRALFGSFSIKQSWTASISSDGGWATAAVQTSRA